MSSKRDPEPTSRLDTAVQHSSQYATSTRETSKVSPTNPQPLELLNGETTDHKFVEPISIGDEEAQPSHNYVQGWKLHMLTLGYPKI